MFTIAVRNLMCQITLKANQSCIVFRTANLLRCKAFCNTTLWECFLKDFFVMNCIAVFYIHFIAFLLLLTGTKVNRYFSHGCLGPASRPGYRLPQLPLSAFGG